MDGFELRQQMMDAGMPAEQVNQWSSQRREEMTHAGLPPEQVAKYWRDTEPDMGRVEAHAKGVMDSLPGELKQKVASSYAEAFSAGLQQSSGGLAARGALPDTVLPENAGLMEKILHGAGAAVGDAPAMVLGALGGATAGTATAGPGLGTLAGAGAGGNALPTALREILMDHYRNPEGSKTWGDFWSRTSNILAETAKSAVAGGIAAPVGGVVGGKVLAAGGSKIAAGAAEMTSMATTATGVGGALDGHVPDASDFVSAAALAVGVHGAGQFVGATGRFVASKETNTVAENLRTTYETHGTSPADLAQEVNRDASVKSEVLAPRRADGVVNQPTLEARRLPDPEPYHSPKPEVDKTALEASKEPKPVKEGETPEPTPFDAVDPAKLDLMADLKLDPKRVSEYGFDPAKDSPDDIAKTVMADMTARFPNHELDPLVAYELGPDRAQAWIAGGRKMTELPPETQMRLQRAELTGAIGDHGINERQWDQVLALQGDREEYIPPGGKPPSGPPPGSGKQGALPPPDDAFKMSAEMLHSKVRDIIAEPEGKEWPRWANPKELIRGFKMELTPFRALDKKIAAPEGQMTAEQMARMTYSSKSVFEDMLKNGPINAVTRERISDATFDKAAKAVKDAGGNFNDWETWRLASRTIELAGRGIESGVDPEIARALTMNKAEAAKYTEGTRILNELKDGIVDYGTDSGLWSRDRAQKMKDLNREHIVLRRLIDPQYQVPGQGGILKVFDPLRRIKGSDKQIVDPIRADMDNMQLIVAMADKNRSNGNIIGAIEASEAKGQVMRIDDLSQGLKGEMDKARTINEQGTPIPQALEEAAAPFLAARQAPGKLGPNDFMFYRDGQPEVWRAADEHIADLLRQDAPRQPNAVAELLSIPAKVARTGIIASPTFWIRVAIHSNLAASAFGDNVGAPGHVFMKGLMSAFKMDEHYDAWVRHGGAGTAISDYDRNYVARNFDQAFEESGTGNMVWNAVNHPIEALRSLQHMIDAAPRIGLMRRLTEAGQDPTVAAMKSRQVFFDHAEAHSAAWVNTWARMSPFFSASFKDIDQVYRAFQERPAATIAKAGIVLTLPTIANYAANLAADQFLDDKDKYGNVDEWVRRGYWVLPPINGDRIKIKKPYVGAFPFATVPEMFLDWAVKNDPRAFHDALGTFVDEVTPYNVMTPTVLQPVKEQYANKAFGRPLIKASLEKDSGYMQYGPDTSLTARKIASILGPAHMNVADMSPIVLQNYARDWAGSLPMTLLRAMEQPWKEGGKPPQTADNPFWGSFFVRNGVGGQAVETFYERIKTFEAAHVDFHKAVAENDPSAIKDTTRAQAFMQVGSFQKAMAAMTANVNAVNQNKGMSPEEKVKWTDAIGHGMVQFARSAIDLMDRVDKQGVGATPSP